MPNDAWRASQGPARPKKTKILPFVPACQRPLEIPAWHEGMSTAVYVQQFEEANHLKPTGVQVKSPGANLAHLAVQPPVKEERK